MRSTWACLVMWLFSAGSPAAAVMPHYRLAVWPSNLPTPDFALRDETGAHRSVHDYRGHILLVFFGFVQCPDACPIELLKLAQVMKQLGPLGDRVRLVFITLDPKHDTPAELKTYLANFDPRFVGLALSRNFGHQVAITAGLAHARGGAVVVMDGDLQDPPEAISALWSKLREGYDVVYGVRQDRQDSAFRVAASRTMQWGMRSMMEIDLPDDVSTFRMMSAPVARLVAALPERRKFFSALIVSGPPYAGGGSFGDGQIETCLRDLTASAAVNRFPLIVVVDDSQFTARRLNNFLWVTFTRSNPAARQNRPAGAPPASSSRYGSPLSRFPASRRSRSGPAREADGSCAYLSFAARRPAAAGSLVFAPRRSPMPR